MHLTVYAIRVSRKNRDTIRDVPIVLPEDVNAITEFYNSREAYFCKEVDDDGHVRGWYIAGWQHVFGQHDCSAKLIQSEFTPLTRKS